MRGATFRPKIDFAHERGALSGKKQTSLMSEAYCMDCFNIPHMSAVHFHAFQCPPHRCAGHCLRGDRLPHDDFHLILFLLFIETRVVAKLTAVVTGRCTAKDYLYLCNNFTRKRTPTAETSCGEDGLGCIR